MSQEKSTPISTPVVPEAQPVPVVPEGPSFFETAGNWVKQFYANNTLSSVRSDIERSALDYVFNPFFLIKETYPQKITDHKMVFLTNTPQNVRNIGLIVFNISVALLTARSGQGIKILVRNTTMAHFGLGMILVPEVYNPFILAGNQCKECEEIQKEAK